MAIIPQIETSTRRIEPVRIPHFPSLGIAGVFGDEVGGAVKGVGDALDRIFEVQRRADEREGESAVMHGVDFMRNGWNGWERRNERTGEYEHVPGVVDRTWREMDADKTNCIDEMKKLNAAVREQDFYKNLTADQRKVFDRKWKFKENEFLRAAEVQHRKNAMNRIVDEGKEQIEWNGERAGEKYGSKQVVVDPRTGRRVTEWEYTANWAGLRNFAVFQGTAITNPEVLDNPNARFEDLKWRGEMTDAELARKRDQYEDQVFAFYKNRITALQKAGASGQGLGEYPSEECLAEADRMVDALKSNLRHTPGPDGKAARLLTDEQAVAIKTETQKARTNREMVISKIHHDNAVKLESELDKVQWKMAPTDPAGGKFDPNAVLSMQVPDENEYRAQLQGAVTRGEISEGDALKLLGRCRKMHEEQRQMFNDLAHPEAFPKSSNATRVVELKMLIADQARNNTPTDAIEGAIERAKREGLLSASDYFSLWHEARKKRDAEDDRITSQVFAEFLKVDEDTVTTAIDTSKRTSKAGAEAVGALLGSPNAEYERSWRIHNPDFTVEDVDEAVRLVRDYVKANPGNSEGARQLLENLVKPHAEAARARTFRDRIQAVRRSRQWSVEKAFAQ